jgi:hypothetical protein
MSNEEAAPETKGVTAELLTTVDLGPEIEGMAGRQLRMRMFTFEPGAVFGRFTTIRTDQASSTYCKERSLTTEMESLRAMGREWAGQRIGTPHTGLRTEERFRRWRSRSISSGLPNSIWARYVTAGRVSDMFDGLARPPDGACQGLCDALISGVLAGQC